MPTTRKGKPTGARGAGKKVRNGPAAPPERLNVRLTEEAAGELEEVSALLDEPRAEALRICASLGAVTVRERTAGRRVVIVEAADGDITGIGSIQRVIGELMIPIRVKPGVKPVEAEPEA